MPQTVAWLAVGCGGGGVGGVRRLPTNCVYLSRGDKHIYKRLIMCILMDKVSRILQECGLGWTHARIRLVKLYSGIRHLQGKSCAGRRDVGKIVAAIVEDWYNGMGPGHAGSPELLRNLAGLEADMMMNVRTSPFYRPTN